MGPAAFKAVEGLYNQPLVGSIPIHSREAVSDRRLAFSLQSPWSLRFADLPRSLTACSVSMIKTIFLLCVWLGAVFVAVCEFAVPALTPGRVNWVAAMIGVACLLAGPWLHGHRCAWRPLFFVYGCLGGLLFIPLFYPNARDFLGQAANCSPTQRAEDWGFAITCIVGVVFAGIVCRLLAAVSYAQGESRQRAPGRCRKCGYRLFGLPEPRCPECGTPFDAGNGDSTPRHR